MATLRKAKCYRKLTRAYTRKSKFKKKGFIKTVPALKVSKFRMGDLKSKFPRKVKLISKESIQIRHNAMESCRTLVNRHLSAKLGDKGYQFIINQYPHHVLRENKMLTGAGADRMQTGMSHSFGKPIGSAAQLVNGTVLFTIETTDDNVEFAKKILKMTKPRVPGKVSILVE